VARVRVKVVGAETGFHQLGGRITFPHRPLTGTEHAERIRAVGFQRRFELLFHDVESLIPTDRREFALFGIFAVGHAQQRLGQTIFPVHDLRQKIAFDTVQAAVHFCLRIALRRHYAAILGADQHATTGAAESARRFFPANWRSQ
jgi:hypothetical protein